MELQEILSQPDGFCPPSVTVKIEKVFPRKAGESENGPWSFQSVKTSDGELKLKNLDAFPEDRVGQVVTLKAYPSKKHGLTGLKVAHEEYQGKTYNKLVVTPTAIWEWAEAHGNGFSPAKSNGNGAAPPNSQTQTRVEPRDIRLESHLLACADLANTLAERLGISEDSARQACFATVCIDAQRHNVILGDSKPADGQLTDNQRERKEALMKGVRSACKLLNDEGYDPPFTPKVLDEYVSEKFESKTVAELSVEDTEDLIQMLSEKLDNFRLNKTVGEEFDDSDQPF